MWDNAPMTGLLGSFRHKRQAGKALGKAVDKAGGQAAYHAQPNCMPALSGAREGDMTRLLTCLLLLSALLAGSAALAAPVPVFVSIVPQKFFVERIAGKLAQVSVMVLPGASPHTYEPKPRQLAALQSAKAYFAVGDPFEAAWLPRFQAANPAMLVVRTDEGVDKMAMAAHRHEDEQGQEHADEAEHAEEPGRGDVDGHGGLDPHIWLSPALVKIQAGNILAGLKAVDPDNAAAYEANHQAFLAELDALDARIRAILAGMQGKEFLVFHPSWGYFARDYGLVQTPIELEGKEPKPEALAKLVGHATERGIRAVFVQPQLSRAMANVVAEEIGAQVVVADPLAGNWNGNLIQVAEKLRAALR